jgi:hypothetical protein
MTFRPLELLDALVNFLLNPTLSDDFRHFPIRFRPRVRQQLVTKSLKIRNESVFVKACTNSDIGVIDSGGFPVFPPPPPFAFAPLVFLFLLFFLTASGRSHIIESQLR